MWDDLGQSGLFNQCVINNIIIESGVTTIGRDAFFNMGCTNITIPASVTYIKSGAFAYNDNLINFEIPDMVKTIEAGIFECCQNLKSVKLPNNMKSVGNGTFLCCNSLESVTIPDNVTSIGNDAFAGCSSLTSIEIPDSVTSIGGFVFELCTSLTSVTILGSVTSIGESAFTDCSSLTSITIPSSVKTIESGAFEGCDIIKDVYFGGSCSDWGNISIGGRNISLRSANIHYASHSYVPVTTNPTCTQKGYTTYTCSVCGDSYVDDYTGALGHMPGEWVVTVVPTEQFEGIKTMYCHVCGEFIHSEVIPKTTSPAFVSSVSVSDVVIEYKSFSELTPQITADEGAEYTVTYTSSDSSIVSVDQNGRVYGEKKGSANITVTVTDSNGNAVTDTCKVSVEYSWWQWIIMTVLFGWLWY